MQRFFCVVLCIFASTCFLRAETVSDVLARMDKAAPSIQAMTAQVQMITYTAVIDDTTTENGTLQMQKKSGELRAIIEFTGANEARTVALVGKLVKIYYPNLKQYQSYDLGKQAQTADQLLLLGFGTSGSELEKSYDVKLIGDDKVDGKNCSRLELTPKDPNVLAKLAKVDLWIPIDAGYPAQQQFFDPPKPGNWRKVTYSNINLNPQIKGTLDLQIPKGAKKKSD
jgi:outer membrane lipoprotein-sorting protein